VFSRPRAATGGGQDPPETASQTPLFSINPGLFLQKLIKNQLKFFYFDKFKKKSTKTLTSMFIKEYTIL
jgi:hypothetical protein